MMGRLIWRRRCGSSVKGLIPRCRPLSHDLAKHILPMPSQVFGMGPVLLIFWKPQTPLRADKAVHHLARNFVARDKDRVILPNRNKSAIEHPMQRARERNPIAHGIAAAALNRSDMGCLNLRPSAAVAQSKARNRTTIIIGLAHLPAEGRIAIKAAGKSLDHRTLKNCGAFVEMRS